MPTSRGQPLAQLRVGGQLEHQRPRELARVGDELVVGLDLVRDLLVAQHPLGARHLLHLPAHRLGVLEHDRHDRPERDPARPLQLDDAPPEVVTLTLVRAQSTMSSTVSLRMSRPRFVIALDPRRGRVAERGSSGRTVRTSDVEVS